MSIANLMINYTIWVFQKLILPVFPVNLPLLSYSEFSALLGGSRLHNLIYSFAGIGQLFNLKLLFILLSVMIFAEVLFWLVRAGFFLIKLIRG